LSRFLEDGLTLVRDVILSPRFDPEEAEKLRPELLASLKQQEDSLPAVAFREFNRLLFDGHPYALNNSGAEDVLGHISAAELEKIYERQARPDKMVIAVAGEVDADKVRELVTNLFGGWAKGTTAGEIAEEVTRVQPAPPAAPKIFALDRDKEQVHLVIGFLGTTLTDPDRYALEVMETILSGQSGRLFQELRDKQSLAYSLSSFTLLGVDTGSVGIYMGTSPAKKDEAIRGVWKELYRMRESPVTPAELEKAQQVLIGQYELGLETHGAQALEMALNQMYGLGLDYGGRYVREIGAVTAEDVLAAARKYIQPDRYVMITVGAKTGQPRPEEQGSL